MGIEKHGNCNVMGIPYQVIIWDEIFREIDKTYYQSLKITSLVWIEVCCCLEQNDTISKNFKEIHSPFDFPLIKDHRSNQN